MIEMTLFDSNGNIKIGKNDYEDEKHSIRAEGKDRIYIATQDLIYSEGDYFELCLSEPNQYLIVQLDQALSATMVFIKGKKWRYDIPLAKNWKEAISDTAFKGKRHYISVRKAKPFEIEGYQNLSINSHDLKDETGAFPHASANVETRNDATFFAKNAIDGIYANNSHGSYPYQSWGINQQDDAELKIDFGRTVEIDEVEITLRADFPHDNHWVKGTIQFSDEYEVILTLDKTADPQIFPIERRKTEWIKLKDLIKDENNPSPFPALTQIAAYGTNIVS